MYMRKRLLQDMSNKEREREQVMPIQLIRSRFIFEIIFRGDIKHIKSYRKIISFLASP